jgi:hypothetical protein
MKNQKKLIVVPTSLVPFVLAHYHFQSHVGPKKLMALINLIYYWDTLRDDCRKFSQGCILCTIYKTDLLPKTIIGVPRVVLEPCSNWQMDVCSGLPNIRGNKSFLCCVDMYTGYCVPIPLKNETSKEIANVFEKYIIRIFGVPKETSSDNAANLAGIELRRLFKFYGIKMTHTTPYSPESHGLVENANRYITELIRIFSDQFMSNWLDTLCVSSLVYNSLPRPRLKNNSPYFAMFLREPFRTGIIEEHKEENLDIDTYLKHAANERNYVKLIREYIVELRKKENAKLIQNYRSYPTGSLIMVKEMGARVHRKIKNIYKKAPQKVVTEYNKIVYAMDIVGRVRKHSKNNIKMCRSRTFELFSKLPEEIKMVLGDVFDEQIWEQYKESGGVPKYLENTEEVHEGIQTRGMILNDTDLVEQNVEIENNDYEFLDDGWFDTEVISKINELHENNLLHGEVELRDIPVMHANILNQKVQGDVQPVSVIDEQMEVQPIQKIAPRGSDFIDTAGINVQNILPENTRRSVRFSLPKSS